MDWVTDQVYGPMENYLKESTLKNLNKMEAGKLIFQTINNVMSDVTAIEKGRKNEQQKYSFRGIDDMYNELHGLFAKHGLCFTSKIINAIREDKIAKSGIALIYTMLDFEFTFYALDGSSLSSVMRGEAMDSGDKASNKAASSALKYALLQMFMIPTKEDKDTESQSHEVLPKAQKQPVEPKEINQADIDKVLFAISLTSKVEELTELYKNTPAEIKKLLKEDFAKKGTELKNKANEKVAV